MELCGIGRRWENLKKIEGTIVESKYNRKGNDLNHSWEKVKRKTFNQVVTVFFKWKPPPVITGRSIITSRDL